MEESSVLHLLQATARKQSKGGLVTKDVQVMPSISTEPVHRVGFNGDKCRRGYSHTTSCCAALPCPCSCSHSSLSVLDTGVRGPLLSQPILEHLQEAGNERDPGASGLFVKPHPETMSCGRDGMLIWSKAWFSSSLSLQCNPGQPAMHHSNSGSRADPGH